MNTKYRPTLFILACTALIALSGCGNSEQNPAVSVDEAIAAENMAKGKAFLEANSSKEGVHTLPSGIQYRVISENEEGRFPKLTDSVHMHLVMKHIDGTVINDTHAAGQPAKVYIKHAMIGWRKVLPKMNVGSKWIVYIPQHLAFSSRGSKDKAIGPNETLICEIELLDIVW